MPGVEVVEDEAFYECKALIYVECDKLEIIRYGAFNDCESLRDINLLSAMIVERDAFYNCEALTEIKFGSKLERIEECAFGYCDSLERITIPLNDGLINGNLIFVGCGNLKHVDLVQGLIHETIASLLLEEWRNVMNATIDLINEILPNTPDGADESWGGGKGTVNNGGLDLFSAKSFTTKQSTNAY